jgi:hypothetical protein
MGNRGRKGTVVDQDTEDITIFKLKKQMDVLFYGIDSFKLAFFIIIFTEVTPLSL